MDNARTMRGAKRLEHLPRDLEAALNGQRAPAPFTERFAFHQLHHQVVGADIVERADIGVVQRRDEAHLAVESLAEALRSDFDRDVAAQPRIKGLVDLTHAAGA